MRQTLQLKLSQHLALTPQLQQSIRLLQLSTLELNQEIEQALQENPLLEREEPGDAMSLTNYAPGTQDSMVNVSPSAQSDERANNGDDRAPAADELSWGAEMPGGHGQRDPNDDNDTDAGDIQSSAISLREHLNTQLGMIKT
jgi:RNA polymerase sigma-54 factor